MKNIFLLILSTVVLNAAAQSFDYFAHNPRWVERYYFESDPSVELELYTQGDSLHDGILYHKLWISGRIPGGISDGRTGFPRIHGLIRQEGNKVWYKGFLTKNEASYFQPVPLTNSDTFPDEFLLFDFGLAVGDTLFAKDLPTIGPEHDDDYFVVAYVDTAEHYKALPNVWSKLVFFTEQESLGDMNGLVEGIGTNRSFLGSPLVGAELGVASGHSLSCHNNDSTLFVDYRYGPTQHNCSGSVESVNETKVSPNAIYPKPSSGTLYFNGVLPAQVKVFNAMGQMVYSDAELSGIQSIALKNYPSGIYNVQYQTNGQWIVEKVVLQN